MSLIVPHLAIGSGDEITIDGVVYKVPLIDSGGRLYINAKATGAGEVLATVFDTVDPSTTRATVATPTAGKKIRIVSYHIAAGSTIFTRYGLYFGLGLDITSDPTKAIANVNLDADVLSFASLSWPDGGGPVGAVDDVVSIRTGLNITTTCRVVIHYREE